jgi:uncharacterized protein (UPF0548 family)
MPRLKFIPIDGTAAEHLVRAVAQQPTYSGGLDPQPGLRGLHRSIRLRRGEESFRQAGETILGWDMHRRAGLRVEPELPRAAAGSTVVLGLGLAGVALVIPCRVNAVYDEPNRLGFEYLTLPGHPECGMEQFLVELSPDGSVHASVTALSRPGTLLVALGGPVSRLAQRRMADRYLAVL